MNLKTYMIFFYFRFSWLFFPSRFHTNWKMFIDFYINRYC